MAVKQPLTSLNLPAKLALAFVSAGSYAALDFLSQRNDAFNAFLSKANSGLNLIAIVFGLLVMAPYAARSGRWALRAAVMCIASAVIYYFAVRFVAYSWFGFDTTTAFILGGSGAALLTGFAVVALAPDRFSWKLIPLTLVAGAIGGAVFEHKFSIVEAEYLGHVAWQSLVCLALHFSFRGTPT